MSFPEQPPPQTEATKKHLRSQKRRVVQVHRHRQTHTPTHTHTHPHTPTHKSRHLGFVGISLQHALADRASVHFHRRKTGACHCSLSSVPSLLLRLFTLHSSAHPSRPSRPVLSMPRLHPPQPFVPIFVLQLSKRVCACVCVCACVLLSFSLCPCCLIHCVLIGPFAFDFLLSKHEREREQRVRLFGSVVIALHDLPSKDDVCCSSSTSDELAYFASSICSKRQAVTARERERECMRMCVGARARFTNTQTHALCASQFAWRTSFLRCRIIFSISSCVGTAG